MTLNNFSIDIKSIQNLLIFFVSLIHFIIYIFNVFFISIIPIISIFLFVVIGLFIFRILFRTIIFVLFVFVFVFVFINYVFMFVFTLFVFILTLFVFMLIFVFTVLMFISTVLILSINKLDTPPTWIPILTKARITIFLDKRFQCLLISFISFYTLFTVKTLWYVLSHVLMTRSCFQGVGNGREKILIFFQ